jgi:hypothetical protein
MTLETKYDRVINVLKKSKPELSRYEDIEEQVIKRIQMLKNKQRSPFEIIDYLFGWVYIGWVRRSLVAASFLIVSVFVYQQYIILKRVNTLSKQTVLTESQMVSGISSDMEEKIKMYKLSGRRFPSADITISKKQMDQLLESINELQVKYKDLINLINENPEMKKYIEKKLTESKNKKFNL